MERLKKLTSQRKWKKENLTQSREQRDAKIAALASEIDHWRAAMLAQDKKKNQDEELKSTAGNTLQQVLQKQKQTKRLLDTVKLLVELREIRKQQASRREGRSFTCFIGFVKVGTFLVSTFILRIAYIFIFYRSIYRPWSRPEIWYERFEDKRCYQRETRGENLSTKVVFLNNLLEPRIYISLCNRALFCKQKGVTPYQLMKMCYIITVKRIDENSRWKNSIIDENSMFLAVIFKTCFRIMEMFRSTSEHVE